ncbi:nitrite reductase small subunit NirD [Longispora albida]|uniref:nitrite reductase small subunit NirD n=1 Tax=Longispora albida TaxID=203523 RepID=UPI000376C07F|nr:nitrite reductase small subunit NirD [Longispora albida]
MSWTVICAKEDLLPGRGVAALAGPVQIAIFLTPSLSLYAVGNLDPASGACVLSRGILGTRAGTPVVASPMHKHAYDLATGRCLDDERLAVPVYPIRERDGLVEVGL